MNPDRLISILYGYGRSASEEPARGWKRFLFPSYEVMQAKIADFLIQQSEERREVAQEFLRVVSGLALDSRFTVFH